MNIGYNGFFLVQQHVEQSRFAGIGFTNNGDGDACFDDIAQLERIGEFFDIGFNFFRKRI